MDCYKGKTYCQFHIMCVHGGSCDRMLTGEVAKRAKEAGLPVAQFAGRPECLEAIWETGAPRAGHNRSPQTGGE